MHEAIANANVDGRVMGDCVEVGPYGTDTIVFNATLPAVSAGRAIAATASRYFNGHLRGEQRCGEQRRDGTRGGLH